VVCLDRSYEWFEKRHKTKGLELAHEQINKAFDTVTWLHKAMKAFSERKFEETAIYIKNLYTTEEEVDLLRTEVFKELSKGVALLADYREDLLHLVKRLDTLADNAKDAARCLQMLGTVELPVELTDRAVIMTSKLRESTQALGTSIEAIMSDPAKASLQAKKVELFEQELDIEYLGVKGLFVKYGNQVNSGALVIFDDLIEFLEQAADMCADTADYIVLLSQRA
jgi:predicted phosphate transport protein (TIGR00153 family)